MTVDEARKIVIGAEPGVCCSPWEDEEGFAIVTIEGETFYVHGEGKTERAAWLDAAARIKGR